MDWPLNRSSSRNAIAGPHIIQMYSNVIEIMRSNTILVKDVATSLRLKAKEARIGQRVSIIFVIPASIFEET